MIFFFFLNKPLYIYIYVCVYIYKDIERILHLQWGGLYVYINNIYIFIAALRHPRCRMNMRQQGELRQCLIRLL
jgi:hypothetical protein